jgi:hypothetical protein
VFYVIALAELILLMLSFAVFPCLLRWRHTNIWRSIGSPWFAYMQGFYNPRVKKFTNYVRHGHYRKLSDAPSRWFGRLTEWHMRFGLWILVALSVVVLLITWSSRFDHVS